MTDPVCIGRWRVWGVASGSGTADTWLALAEHLATTTTPCHRSKHAATYRAVVDGRDVYLKRYHRYRWRTVVKDTRRPSKARHVARVSAVLTAAGVRVPAVLAVAEQRRGPVVVDAWVATAALDGVPVAERLADLAYRRAAAAPAEARMLLVAKRCVLTALGAAVADLHRCGFVAGDLVPTNVWVTGATATIAFLDHDRTRREPAPARWRRARRNLVQLNRVVLTGVVATDRARVYRAYAAGRGWTPAEARRRLPWIIAKTIARRRRFDGVADAAVLGFRRLMRAPAPAAATASAGETAPSPTTPSPAVAATERPRR